MAGFELEAASSEWLSLEVARGLRKDKDALGLSDADILDAYSSIEDLFTSTALKQIKVSDVKDVAGKIIVEQNLYAADSIYLASAVISASDVILSEDEHLHKEKVRKYARNRGIEIMKLKDFRF